LRFVYRFVDFALYVGTNNKNYYLKHGLDKKKLIFAPHAVDNGRFDDIDGVYTSKALTWSKELDMELDDIVFMFAGKFESKKDPLILLRAANIIENPKFKYVFVGNGVLENEMKKLANGNKNIFFLPFQNQTIMPVLYRLGDVFVLPSQGPFETWGLAVNEAMACGKPVLVSDKVGCAVDLVKEGQNGFIFKAENLEDLVKKINSIDIDSIQKFGKRSKEFISEYSFVEIAKTIENELNKLKN
jgi:glycosyltransferase involved in cell wall biosynthesis